MTPAERRRPPVWRRYLRFWGTDLAADVREELAFHLEMRAREFEARGMAPDDARRAAHERFGDVAEVDAALQAHDRHRERGARWRELLPNAGRDLRQAIRSLAHAPSFSIGAILCLALGTGASAAVFSLVDAFFLRPYPAAHPANLVVIAAAFAGDAPPGEYTYPEYLAVRAQHAALQTAVAAAITPVAWRIGGRSDRRILEGVSENYWSMLGVQMTLGRAFTASEVSHRDRLLVISYDVWQREFQGAGNVIGAQVTLNGIPMTVVGVAPRGFRGLAFGIDFDGWVPATVLRDLDPGAPDPVTRAGTTGFYVLGRLQPGVSAEGAERMLVPVAQALEQEYPVIDRGLRFVVAPESDARPDIAVAGVVPKAALAFAVLTVLVFLIACANVASLMATRVSGRQGELAVRMALGAGPLRLVRQVLVETLVIAALGGMLGVIIVLVIVGAINSLPINVGFPVEFGVAVDWRVLALTGLATAAAAVASGLGPAIRTLGAKGAGALTNETRSGGLGAARQRFRTTLVTAQVAVSFVLLIVAGLFIRSLQRAAHVDLGFRQDHGLLATIDVSLAQYDTARGKRFFRTLVQEAAGLTGVRAAALGRTVPLGPNHGEVSIYADLPTLTREKGRIDVELNVVTPRYFDAMGIRMLSGRAFTDRDDTAAAHVMVINKALATRLWPGRDPVGQLVRLDPGEAPVEIVGVVATVTSLFLGERPQPIVYVPFAQQYDPRMTLHLWTAADPQAFVGPVRALVASIDPNVAPYSLTTMTAHLRDGIAFLPARFAAMTATGIGMMGLLLAVVGLYGVVAYSVAQRRREIGIRMAMGATSTDILLNVVQEGMLVTAIGLAAGFVLALGTTRLVSGLLIEVGTRDPVTFATLAGALAVVTLMACWIPARRATTIAPASIIRTN